jgi:PAS domain S-box-containing protein
MQVSNPASTVSGSTSRALSAAECRRRFRWLIFHTWNIPPVFGLGFILLIGVLTPAQILGILTTPLEPAYILGWLAFAMWFLPRTMRPLADWLDGKPGSSPEQAVRAVRRFPLRFWTTFLIYLAIAPASVILAAKIYTGFVATPYDWFRIELVALIVSIIVGLPIFFLIFDLFGQALGGAELKRPIITVKTKVFLIGALVPLLIDTMLVQYYWTRTGYFSFETFGVWLLLELLAIGGSLIFAHSFGQSLDPLQRLIGAPRPLPEASVAALRPRSTDELGQLTADYRLLLDELRLRNEILELNNRLLRSSGGEGGTAAVFTAVVDLCRQAIGADQSFLIVYDAGSNCLMGVAQSGSDYRPDGHYRLALDDQSMAVWAFTHRETVVIENASSDPRVSQALRTRFGIQSAMATPLRLGTETLGVLMVAHTASAYAYGAREAALLEGLAREAAFALHTQRLRQERERAEAGRREQVEQVRLLMDATEEGIYGLDTDGYCTFINGAALRMLGYRQPEDLLGRNLHELIHHTLSDGRTYPEEQCRVRLATLAGETAHTDEEVHWRADGTSFPVEYWSRPIVRAGRTVGTVVSFVDISERKHAEEQNRRTSALLDSVIENLPNMLFLKRASDLRFELFNKAGEELLGLKRADLLGKNDYDLFPKEQADFFTGKDRAVLATSGPVDIPQEPIDTRTRGQRILHTRKLALRNSRGEPEYLLGISEDVTEHIQAQLAVQKSEARFRLIIEASPVPYALNDENQNITYLNPAFVRTFGYTCDDIPTLADWWPRAYPDPVYRQWVATEWAVRLDRARAQGSAFEPMELNIRCKDGSRATVVASAASLGKVFAGTHLVILYDITARKQAEQALRASEERLRTILETEPECVKILAADGGLVEMNPAGLAMIEADSLAQVQGQKVANIVTGEYRAAFKELIRRVIEKGESGRLEFEIVGLKGTRCWLETNAVPLRDEATGETRLLGVTRDITERRRAEESIRTLNVELEQRVKVRTAELAAANKELEAFCYSVSHDLRAPLRAIDGFARALREDFADQFDDAGRDYLARVIGGAQRMGLLIDDLLHLSRASRAPLQPVDVDLSAVAQEVVAQLAATEPERRVAVEIAPALRSRGDTRLLQIALTNLLENAWKYTGRTEYPRIVFGQEQVDGEYVFYIGDNGVGFDMQYAGKLFGAFQRLHGADFPGSGIGLATVQRIIARHGGRVWAEGVPGQGATFFFTLEAAPVEIKKVYPEG